MNIIHQPIIHKNLHQYHHSTALTTSKKIAMRTKNEKVRKLANEIIETQEREIKQMKDLIL